MTNRKSTKAIEQQLRVAVLKRFRIIFGSIRKHFREVERASGITGSQLWILNEISRSDGIGVSDLAQKLAIHQSTCSLLVEKLVRSGRVKKQRPPSDHRRVELSLTARGRLAIARAPGPAEGVLPEALAQLTSAELRRLQTGLERVIEGLDLEDERAGDRPLSDL